jgi:hypothetical protein
MRFKIDFPFAACFAEGGALINPDEVSSIPAKYDDEAFDAATSAKYLPRLQLMTSNSGKCKSAEFPINHYAIVRDQNFEDLGKSCDVLVVDWRPKALEIGEQIVSIFDHESPEFKRIQVEAEGKDSGCMWGPEFLVYVPASGVFATFFMGTKSSRRESPALKALLHKAATLTSHEIKTPAFTWYAPQVTKCTTEFDLPDKESLKEVVDKFRSPDATEVERVEDTEGEREQ